MTRDTQHHSHISCSKTNWEACEQTSWCSVCLLLSIFISVLVSILFYFCYLFQVFSLGNIFHIFQGLGNVFGQKMVAYFFITNIIHVFTWKSLNHVTMFDFKCEPVQRNCVLQFFCFEGLSMYKTCSVFCRFFSPCLFVSAGLSWAALTTRSPCD